MVGDNQVASIVPRWSSSHEGHHFRLDCTVGSCRHCSSGERARRECAQRENLRRTGPPSPLTKRLIAAASVAAIGLAHLRGCASPCQRELIACLAEENTCSIATSF